MMPCPNVEEKPVYHHEYRGKFTGTKLGVLDE